MGAAGVKCGVLDWLEIAWQDVRYATRGLVRQPAFSLTIIVAAALGIGATTAVFSLVDRVFLRPLPYANQERLVSVGMTAPLDTNEFLFTPAYLALRKAPGPFEAITSFQAGAFSCDISEQNPIRERCLRVESNFLDTLGVLPVGGRMFSRAEDVPNGPRVAVISYGLWRSRFASDPAAAGRVISLDGVPTTIIGVLPEDFEIPTLAPADILIPQQLSDAPERAMTAVRAFARMSPGVSTPQARAALAPYFEYVLVTVPAPLRKEMTLTIRSVRDRQIGDARIATYALFASVIALLLIACANIANMLLARAIARRNEFATRAALGASRTRLARQALAESMVLGILGGAAGCALAYALLRVFVALAPSSFPRLAQASVDLRVLGFAFGVSLAAGLLFGLVPALRMPRDIAMSGWKATPRIRGGLRTALLTAQIAISLVLLNGAALLLRSLQNIENVPLGIQTDRVVVAHIELGRVRYAQEGAQLAFFDQLEQRLGVLRGANAFAVTDSVPPAGGMHGRPLASIEVEGQARRAQNTGEMVGFRYVTPGYFSALGIRLLRGRTFDEHDRAPGADSIVISETLSRRLFGNDDPLNRHLLREPPAPWLTVIGVVADVKNNGPQDSAAPEYYLPRKSSPIPGVQGQAGRAATAMIRSSVDPALAASELRDAISAVDSTVPIEIETMKHRVEGVTQRPRFDAILLIAFAVTGTLLAAIGLFGVTSFFVEQGTREIGVRVALGATPREILQWTLAHAARWISVGVVLGVGASLASARYLRSLLFQVAPADMRALLFAVFLLCVVALIAATIPARRAMRVDPIVTLRHE
ncbi:MAG TPA: ABC transporter permease [Candidatus Acidoferrales bacterium]|nr:ABC transporter permease [Candidatus Acidoferrales bacterium]